MSSLSQTAVSYDIFPAAACASYRPETENQDVVAADVIVARGDVLPGAYATVCDGVGSLPESRTVALLAAEYAAATLRASGAHATLEAIDRAHTDVADFADGATTVLAIAASTDGSAHYALCGNGCVLSVEAIAHDAGHRIAWSSLASPHFTLSSGQPALRSFAPMPAGRTPEVTGGMLRSRPGRMTALLACSDGVMSEEERRVGHLDGTRWVEVPVVLEAIERVLAQSWGDLERDESPDRLLEHRLQATLDDLAEHGHLHDDTTIGALLLRPRPA